MKGYKTLIFNTLMAVIAVVYALNPDAEKPSIEQVHGAVDTVEAAWASVMVVGNAILRAVTTSAIFKKE
jgi:hypothetical protein